MSLEQGGGRRSAPGSGPGAGRASAVPGPARPRAGLLRILALAILCAPVTQALAQTDGSPGFALARLKYDGGGDWYSNPTSLPNLIRALKERTTVPLERQEEVRVSILDPEFFNYPFLYMNGHGSVRFTETERERLRSYLLHGGFLFADDNYGLDESFRQEMARVFPDRPLVEIPFDHPIYSSFYELPHGPPKVHEHDGKPSQGLGILDGDRLIVFYTYQADIGDGLEDPDVHSDPPDVREQAMQMAVNVVVYALTR